MKRHDDVVGKHQMQFPIIFNKNLISLKRSQIRFNFTLRFIFSFHEISLLSLFLLDRKFNLNLLSLKILAAFLIESRLL